MKDNLLSRTVVRKMLRASIKDPDKNIPRIIDAVERIIDEGTALGTYTYIFSGGEPTMRKTERLNMLTTRKAGQKCLLNKEQLLKLFP